MTFLWTFRPLLFRDQAQKGAIGASVGLLIWQNNANVVLSFVFHCSVVLLNVGNILKALASFSLYALRFVSCLSRGREGVAFVLHSWACVSGLILGRYGACSANVLTIPNCRLGCLPYLHLCGLFPYIRVGSIQRPLQPIYASGNFWPYYWIFWHFMIKIN